MLFACIGISTRLTAELAINALEDDARQAVMLTPEDFHASLEQIVVRLEDLFEENVTVP